MESQSPKSELAEIYCSTCGCPREPHVHPCPECRDWQFAIVPNVLYLLGWLRRNEVLF